MTQELTGRLLVATPLLTEPTFARAVLLVLDHDRFGSLGVVLNRPTELEVARVLPPWAGRAADPGVMFSGGPVSVDSALGLAAVVGDAAGGEAPVGWQRLYGGMGLVDLDAPPEVVCGGLSALRVFAGYAGWSPGQLEGEIGQGAWYVVDAEPGDAFSAEPDGMWRRVLRRQRDARAFVATRPDDPTMN